MAAGSPLLPLRRLAFSCCRFSPFPPHPACRSCHGDRERTETRGRSAHGQQSAEFSLVFSGSQRQVPPRFGGAVRLSSGFCVCAARVGANAEGLSWTSGLRETIGGRSAGEAEREERGSWMTGLESKSLGRWLCISLEETGLSVPQLFRLCP